MDVWSRGVFCANHALLAPFLKPLRLYTKRSNKQLKLKTSDTEKVCGKKSCQCKKRPEEKNTP